MVSLTGVSVRGTGRRTDRPDHGFRPVEVSPLEVRQVPAGSAMAAPWVTYRDEIVALFARERGIHVDPLVPVPGGFILELSYPLHGRGESLATVLKPEVNLGGMTVSTIVVNHRGQIYPAIKVRDIPTAEFVEDEAFRGNRLYRFTEWHQETSTVYPVFTKSIIQFRNGSPSDFFRNFNEVTANVARDVLDGELGQDSNGRPILVYPSTAEAAE